MIQPASVCRSHVAVQTMTKKVVGVGPCCDVSAVNKGVCQGAHAGQQDLVGQLALVLSWLSEMGILSTSLVGSTLAGASKCDVIGWAWRLVSHLGARKGIHGSQVKGPGPDNTEGAQTASCPSLTPSAGDQGNPAATSSAQQVASASGASTQQWGNVPAVVTPTMRSSLTQGAEISSSHSSPLMDLDDIRSEREQLGLLVPVEVRKKIWKGAYIDIFDLLVDKSDKEEVKGCSECAHLRECGHWPQKLKVVESLSNWVKAFSIYLANLAERFGDLGTQLACYQNRIVGATM
ncbi:hypothetical protein NDU88_006585 [Pleurodeles waltl]|uniref:Uncharacterized protein n=1 Tax=Pleurodeles waltl TaxID=8319 RepID=A0AAV7PJ56_PLEWA|nr:hypothetical protein NDU88_006585 [Pleurodeles waltl]